MVIFYAFVLYNRRLSLRFGLYCVFSTIQNSIVHCIAEGAKDNIDNIENTEKGREHL